MIAGNNVIVGNDFTLHAATAGTVQFRTVRRKAFSTILLFLELSARHLAWLLF
jgi:ribosomal protein L27